MMRSFSLSELRPLLQARLLGPDCLIRRVSTDTRNIREGDLFLALRGERFDGHDFVREAQEQGAVAVVADCTVDCGVPILQVDDTQRALGQLGAFNRSLFRGPVVAVTGSNGKTTVKELLRRIFLQQGPVLATQGNLNNAIGAPLTLLQLGPDHKAAIIELGASGPGEITWTASLAAPEVSIITNAGEAHMAGFGSHAGLVAAKGEIIAETLVDGVVVLNLDDPASSTWRAQVGQRTLITTSAKGNPEADIHAQGVIESDAGLQFHACLASGDRFPVSLRLSGVHNVGNALLAIAAARALGVDFGAIEAGLAAADPVQGRMQVLSLGPTLTAIDDSYNANPTAMRAALRTLAQREGIRIAVLGDMAELGGDEAAQHREVGALAQQLGIEALYATGRHADDYAGGFGPNARTAPSHGRLVELLMREYIDGASAPETAPPAEPGARITLLVKGSRSARMDQIIAILNQKVHT